MKAINARFMGVAWMASVVASLAPHAPAGDLNPPPGPIAPTNRVVLNNQAITLPFTINQPGSYVLTSNLTAGGLPGGITIDADSVTLDLNGFMIDGVGLAGSGVRVLGGRNAITIRNGSIRGWGGQGVEAGGLENGTLIDLMVADNGLNGVTVGHGNTLTRVVSRSNGSVGFEGQGNGNTYHQCASNRNVEGYSTGIGDTLEGCTASNNTNNGFGISEAGTARGCAASENGTNGYIVAPGGTLTSSTARDNGLAGIFVFNDTIISNNVVHNFLGGGTGIEASGSGNRASDNQVSDCATGLLFTSPAGGNVIADNVVKDNGINYIFTPGNQVELLLCELPVSIDWAGTKVKLAGSLQGVPGANGIEVNADDVTIDLNGFSLDGVVGSGTLSGIEVLAPQTNLAVRNGTIRGWGGMGLSALNVSNGHYTDLRVQENALEGLFGGAGSLVGDSTFRFNGAAGARVLMSSNVSNCTSVANGGEGFVVEDGSIISHCTARDNIIGIVTIFGSYAHHCLSRNNIDLGIFAELGGTVTECTVRDNGGPGIRAFDECVLENNRLMTNGFGGGPAFGIEVLGTLNRITGNDVKASTTNYSVMTPGNTIHDNSSTTLGADYAIVPGNDVGPIGPSGAPQANVVY